MSLCAPLSHVLSHIPFLIRGAIERWFDSNETLRIVSDCKDVPVIKRRVSRGAGSGFNRDGYWRRFELVWIA